MKEQLITFETAKLTKEKGFDWECDSCFNKKYHENDLETTTESNWNSTPHLTSAPTQSLLQKWLREHHGISIKIDDFFTNSKVRYDYNVSSLGSQDDNPKGVFLTYEDALEEALYYALGQIIIN